MVVYKSTCVILHFCLCKYFSYAALELQAKLLCWFTFYECVQLFSTIKKKGKQEVGLIYTHRVLLKRTSNQRQANDFLWLGNKLSTCHTHRTSNTHNFNIWILCVQNRPACVCVWVCVRLFPLQAQSGLSSVDLGLFLAVPPGLRHLRRAKESAVKTGSQFLDDKEKKLKREEKKVQQRWSVRFCNCSDIRERPVL